MRGALSSLMTRLGAMPKWWGRRVGLVGVRRGLVAVLLLGWLAVLLISAFTPHLQVCSDEVARVGSTALAKSCESLSFTDAPSLAVLVIVGLLLLPDLSSLEIPGILRVEREIKDQARRQDDIVAMIHRLEVSQHVEVNYNEVGSRSARVGELAALQDEKRERFESPAT
jgi:hypothetical protein